MASIPGKDVVIQLSTDGTTYKTLICETSNTFSLTRETSSTSTKCNNGTATVSLGAYTWEISGEAVADTAPSVSQLSYEEVLGHAVAGTLLYVLMEHPADGTNFTEKGTAYITSLERTAATDDAVAFSFTLSGQGAVTIVP